MSVKRLRTGDYVAGIGGLVLFCSLFAPWYDYPLGEGTSDGWRSLQFIDLFLLATALLAMAIPLVTAAKDSPAVPVALDVISTFVAFLATILVLVRVISPAHLAGDPAAGRSWGLWLALLAVLVTLAGAWLALRDEDAPGLREPPEVRAMPMPPEHDPATPPQAT